jgi:glucoamylase
VRNTIAVIDAVIKVDTPAGPAWHRYNHDGYGQARDGGPFTSYGVGRVWPLLTGERGHYELAAGRSPAVAIRTMEQLASKAGLLPEQSWDGPDIPEAHMFFGKPTGSAMPLAWAHAEYIKLLRSAADGVVFDRFPEVAERYITRSAATKKMEVWSFNRRVRFMHAGETLRVIADARFRLHWTNTDWSVASDVTSGSNALGIDYVDLTDVAPAPGTVIAFTFFWIDAEVWEEKNYTVTVR